MSARALPGSAAPAFRDRREAGRRLGERLHVLEGERPIVVGLPRGGVPVAFEVARALGAPLDVVLVRKIGCPLRPELGIGALAEDGTLLIDHAAVTAIGLTQAAVAAVVSCERAVLRRQRRLYRSGREPVDVAGRTVIVVDDGVATGGTARVAARSLRRRGAKRIVVAVPVGPPGIEAKLIADADEVVCLEQPDVFAVGQAYEDFLPTPDDEVVALLEQ